MYAYLALAGVQAVGGFQQADIIRQNGQLQQKIAGMNAEFADIDSENALTAGYSQADRYKKVIDSTIAQQREAYASSGVTVGYGSAGKAESDASIQGLTNTLELQRHAREAAMGFQVQKINIQLGGAMKSLQSETDASTTQNKGLLSAASTTISGYERGNSTGTGNTSRTGTSDKPTWKSASLDLDGSRFAGGSDFASEVG